MLRCLTLRIVSPQAVSIRYEEQYRKAILCASNSGHSKMKCQIVSSLAPHFYELLSIIPSCESFAWKLPCPVRICVVGLNPFGLKPFLYVIEEGECYSTLCRDFPSSLPHLCYLFSYYFSYVSFPITVPFISMSLSFLISNRALRSYKSRSMGVCPATTQSDSHDAVRLYVL